MLTLRGTTGPRRGTQLQQLNIITDGSLLVRDRLILEVGPTRRVENLTAARHAIEVNAAGRVVMPGFVDSHTHLLFPPPGPSKLDAEGEARALRAMSAIHLKSQAQIYLQSMVRHGTTTAEVKTGCGHDEATQLKILRVANGLRHDPLHLLSSLLVGSSSGEQPNEEAAFDWICERLLPKARRRQLVQFADLAANGPEAPKEAGRFFDLARRLGLPCKVHADRVSPAAILRLAIEHGVLSIDHLEHATTADAGLLGRSPSIATVLPAPSFHGTAEFAPARNLIDSGAALALATNFNPHHTPTLSMQTVIALACRFLGMSPEEAIAGATINGAHALGLSKWLGSLEPGKWADLVMLNVSDYHDLAHSLGANLVRMTMKSGSIIYEEGTVAPRAIGSLRPAW